MRSLNPRQVLTGTLVATVLFEGLALLFHFVFGWEARVTNADNLGWLTGGFRLHPGLLGLLMLVAALVFRARRAVLTTWLIILGGGLLISDLIRHLFILWPITGNPDLSLFYPQDVPPEGHGPSRRL